MSQNSKKDQSNDSGGLVILILAAVVLFFLSPGILTMGIINANTDLALDPAQMWTFALVVSIGLYTGFYLREKSFLSALKHYMLTCLIIVLATLVAHFGLKAEWPAAYLQDFIPAENR